MSYIYVLALENDKYFIGKTDSLNFTINDHINFYDCNWTKKYKPLELKKIFPASSIFDEDMYTLMYMNTHGIAFVRGGSFKSVILDHMNTTIIRKMIYTATNKCYKCGSDNHKCDDCDYEEYDEETEDSSEADDDDDSEASFDSQNEESDESDDSDEESDDDS